MKIAKKTLSVLMAVLMVLSCWVWTAPNEAAVANAAEAIKDKYLFAYFTGTSKEGQTIHLAVSEDGYNYTALRNNEPVIIPSKGVGNVRDPYIWYNEQDNYYYILATDLDFTDTKSNYSNNSQSFIIWRSKDLVNWYDETMIDVSKMAHLIGDTRDMSAVWAPQVLWDGSAYVVYFTLVCRATNSFEIVYLKTSDIIDQNAYYEFGFLLRNFLPAGNNGNIDADIIHNPGDGKYYLFYKTENNAGTHGHTANGTPLKTIHYYVGDTPTGPFRNPGDTKWPNAGFSVFPNYNVSLEGCNSFFDNDGNLIMYVDEFEHTNSYTGEAEAYFHIAKSDGYDFTSWSYPDVSSHNINSLSPRHGSVVKITEAEYNRLLNNSYNISSSSYSDTETLEDHLVAQYFTTGDVKWNNVYGQPNLASSTGITMVNDPSIGYYAEFDRDNGGWAEVDFDSLFLNGLNYEDGFTITFNAMLQPNAAVNNENNDRIYEIANIFGDQASSNAYYTHFSPGGGGSGSYVGNYNGPVEAGSYDWLSDKDGSNRDDEKFHEYIISYATGNVMVYVDGELVISRNRFYGGNNAGQIPLDALWYEALGSNATMRIGRSGWDADPLFKGRIQNLCIYDCSMSYYDAQTMNDDYKENLGWVEQDNYTGITSAIPTFQHADTTQMSTPASNRTNAGAINYVPSEHYSNILYTTPVTGTPNGEGEGEDANPTATEASKAATATYAELGTNSNFIMGIYYSHLTVLLYDGRTEAKMPVMLGGRINANNYAAYLNCVYPTEIGSMANNNDLQLKHPWYGWTYTDKYWDTVQNPDGTGYRIGYNSSTATSYKPYFDSTSGISGTQAKRDFWYFASTLAVTDNVDFGDQYYKKHNLHWRLKGEGGSDTFDTRAIAKNSTIYIVNFKPILDLREEITESAYNEVMNDSRLCPELKEKYASAVYTIRTLDPNNFGFDTAPVTATKACGKAIGEAVGTYEGVMAEIAREEAAGTYGHQPSTFEAREATCAINGLTEGSYCVICGEILKEQEVIAHLPHNFTEPYDNGNGTQIVRCQNSGCGLIIEYCPYEVRYENLFSLNRWSKSASNTLINTSNGSITTDLINGTITITNKLSTENYTPHSGTGTQAKAWNLNSVPLNGGQEYVLEVTTSGNIAGQILTFEYDKNGTSTNWADTSLYCATAGKYEVSFKTATNTAYMEIRFDAESAGTITFSQIGIYEKEEFDKFGATTADARLGFYPGDSKKLCVPNPADGYTFGGWYTKSGIKIENVNQLNNPSTVVYGKWIPAGFDLTYDSIFSFSSWAKSSCNQLWYGDIYNLKSDGTRGTLISRLASEEGILADAENGTISITWDAENITYSDNENKKLYQYCARTDLHKDPNNLYKIPVKKNTEYVIEYTASSDNGAKANVCAYMPNAGSDEYGNNLTAQESGSITRNGLGTQYFHIYTNNADFLVLRFDNVQIGSTITYSDIAVYEASFEEAARTIENREYRRYYPQTMGFGNIFEYTPVRPGFTFDTWIANVDLNGDSVLDSFDCKNLDDTALVEQNWQVFSTWNENSYTIKYDANGGSGTVANQTQKYTSDAKLETGGFTRAGYKLAGWSTVANATTAQYQLGQTTNRLVGENNGTITLYAVWELKFVNVTFDNMFDFDKFTINTGSLTVNERTETGFTVTSKSGTDANTGFSYEIPVEPGKTYILSADVSFVQTSGGYDMYIHTLDATKAGETTATPDTTNGAHREGNVYISLTGQTTETKPYIRFTAGTGTSYIKIRFDANAVGNKLTVNNIRFNEDNGVEVNPANMKVKYNTAYGNLPEAYKQGYNFVGWFDEEGKYVNANTVLTSEKTVHLKSKWVVSAVVVDFDAPVTINPFDEKDSNFFTLGEITASGNTGTFTKASNAITYTPGKTLSAFDTVEYTVSYGDTKKSFDLIVAPANNMLYEEDIFTVTNTTGNAWTTVGTATNVTQSQSTTKDIYGYDEAYNNNATYSGGSAYQVTVDSTNKRGQIMSFDFTGTGYDLYGQCANNSGIMVVTVKDSTGKAIKASVVDTYYSGNTLNQVPVVGARDLAYGNYNVQVSALYLASAGALQGATAQAAFGLRDMVSFASPMSTADMLYEALCEVGLEEVFEVDDLEINWFDEGSVLNGGNGASTYALGDEGQTTATTRTATTLVNVIDSVRIYNPGNPDVINDYYPATELSAKYLNIMSNLDNNNLVSGTGNFTYVTFTPDKTNIDFATYEPKGSNEEFYLKNDGSALGFSIKRVSGGGRIMVSLRAAEGTATSAKIGENTINVTSATEMYYDITEYINSDGTVTIQNGGNGLLAIGNIKVTSDAIVPVASNTFNMRSARMMMMAPPRGSEPDVPEEPSTEETTTEEVTTEEVTTEEVTTEEVTTEEVTTEEVTTEETTTDAEETTTVPSEDNEESEESFIDKIYAVIDWFVKLFKKLISSIKFITQF